MANYKSLSGSKISFTLKVTEEDLKKAQAGAMDYFRNNVSLKGFRKGHATDDQILAVVGPQQVALESASRALDKKYREFVKENEIYPVSAPKIENFDPTKLPCDAKVEVEVYPEVKLGNYKKIKLSTTKVEVTKKEIEDVIETLIAQQGVGKEVDRGAKEGDQVVLDFVGKNDKGEVIKNTEGKDVKVRLGLGQFIPEFEKATMGMKAGEEKKGTSVKFPSNYPAKEMAGKKIAFDITCKSVVEISGKDIDEATIEKIAGQKKSVEEFHKDIEGIIRQNKEQSEKKKAMDEYQQKLAKEVKVDLPESWLEKEVVTRFERFKQNPAFLADPAAFWKEIGETEESLKKRFRKDAETDLSIFLGFSEIIKQEKIELDKDEMERAHKIAHQHLEKGHEDPRHDEEMQKAILNLKIDKYLQSLTI